MSAPLHECLAAPFPRAARTLSRGSAAEGAQAHLGLLIYGCEHHSNAPCCAQASSAQAGTSAAAPGTKQGKQAKRKRSPSPQVDDSVAAPSTSSPAPQHAPVPPSRSRKRVKQAPKVCCFHMPPCWVSQRCSAAPLLRITCTTLELRGCSIYVDAIVCALLGTDRGHCSLVVNCMCSLSVGATST